MDDHTTFMPHGICYLWQPELVWLHVISDAVIALAYYAIPPALLVLVLRTREAVREMGAPGMVRGLPFEWVYLAFGMFIIACGTTHAMGVWTIWEPRYWLSGGVKVVTAVASVATAVALPPLVPRIVAMVRASRMSERHRLEIAHLAAVVEHSGDAIITKDLNGIITTWNRGAEALYGYSAEEMIGRDARNLLPPDFARDLDEMLARVVRGHNIIQHEATRLRADGRRIEVSITESPIRDEAGNVIAVSSIARDITDRKRAQQQAIDLAQARAAQQEAEKLAHELRALDQARSEFLAVMSHELRTPLNAVLGYAEILNMGIHGPLTSKQHEQLSRIIASVGHLRALIDQVLQFTRLEAGRAHPEPADIELRQLVQDVVDIMTPAAASKQLEIRTDLPADVHIRTDPVFLRQILLNLLSNAIKFTQHGSVRVCAVRTAEGGVTVQVQDTGIGIAAEHLERIFEPFWQVDSGRARRSEGTGLGLSVARRLARLLGGDLRVSSRLGEGSTFSVSLPA